ncbi:MAG: hypothetical protein COA73_02455 [Candidatus Hydrogenedentota bacterium]|nr:MAG: hypothetical protein COA73_02455 [Candidatus Hydrogenedentota bacterium]
MEPTGLLTIMLWLWLFFAIKLGFIGTALLIQHRMPGFIKRVSERYRTKPNRLMLLLGLINSIAIPFIAVLLISTEVLALPGILLLLLYLWLALVCYTVVYREIGSNLFEEFASNKEVKITLYGGLIAEAAFFTPVLGQILSLALFIKSMGAITMVLLTRKKRGV